MDNELEQTQPEQQDDLRATLSSALAEAKARDTDTQQIETQEEKKDRLRDDHGRFAKSQHQETKEPAKTLDLGAAPQTVEMPKTWNVASKGYWDKLSGHWVKLPPEVQQLIDSREQEVHKGFTKHDDERAFGREMHKAVAPYLQMIQAEGGTPSGVVSNLMQTAALLRTGTTEQKTQAIMNVCRQFNIPLSSGDGKQPEGNPQIAALQSELHQLKSYIQQRQWQEQQEAQSSVQSEIDAFSSDPANVHFEAVKPRMAVLLKEGQAKDLKEAYDMAVWADSSLRTQLLADREREAEQKREEERKAKADAARRKVSSIPGAPGNTQSTKANGSDRSLRDEIRASMAEASGRV